MIENYHHQKILNHDSVTIIPYLVIAIDDDPEYYLSLN